MTAADAAAGDDARPGILAFDTAGGGCSVAVVAAERVLAVHSRTMVHGQAEVLLPMVDAAMRAAALPTAALDLVATTVGPGSFTGIRVGLAAAQGIALAAELPLIGVTGFEAVAAGMERKDGDGTPPLLVAIESRRAELYVQIFVGTGPLGEPAAVAPAALAVWTASICGACPLIVTGDAAVRAVAALAERPRTMLAAPAPPVALGVARAALRRWRRGDRHGRSEPLYLRLPDVTRPDGRDGPGTS